MAKFKVLEPSFINNRIHAVGEIVDIEFTDGGVAGQNLEALEPDVKAKKGKKAAVSAEVTQLQKLGFTITPPPGSDGDDASDLT